MLRLEWLHVTYCGSQRESRLQRRRLRAGGEREDRARIERLVRGHRRSVGRARGPLALERLHALGGQEALLSPDACLLYRLPEPDLQGRTALLLSPLELLERLARLIPPPRIHRHRYHGLLAPHTRLRAMVVAIGKFDNTQSGANHVHSNWRDLTDDFGEDLLRRHYEGSVHHH